MESSRFYRFAGVACIILVMLTGAMDRSFLTTGALVLAACALAITPLALTRPLWAAGIYGVFFAITAWHPDWRSFLMLAWSALIVGMVAFRRRWEYAALFSALYVLLALVDPNSHFFLAADFFSTLLSSILYVAAIAIGINLKRSREKQLAAKQRAAEEREALMTTLHDSVSATLTSVVMRSETLALVQKDPALVEAATAIADDARQAMGEVRDLLRVMKSDNLPKPGRSVCSEVSALEDLLRSHNFDCDMDVNLGKCGELGLPKNLHLIFSELGANILKYAPRNSTVTISAESINNGFKLRIESEIAEQQSPAHMTTKLGLDDITKRVNSVGGTFHSGKHGDLWITRLSLPKDALMKV
ncbi:sensor histidine kinase [Corynebacterium sp.]|uniref:sensor histidine kinase n=1 Tax=Corynebacterium sp. TaxID=1720 RepID=UPI0026DB1E74|nr:histidine kinase [Corynebacterium sp.]MDO5032154.1 histidine kinase [Corynebacterium sp.]